MKKLIILSLVFVTASTMKVNAQDKKWIEIESWSLGANLPSGRQVLELKNNQGSIEFMNTNGRITNVKFNDKSSGRTVVRLLTSVQYPYSVTPLCEEQTIEGGYFASSDGAFSVCIARSAVKAGYDLKAAKKV